MRNGIYNIIINTCSVITQAHTHSHTEHIGPQTCVHTHTHTHTHVYTHAPSALTHVYTHTLLSLPKARFHAHRFTGVGNYSLALCCQCFPCVGMVTPNT